MSVGPAWLVIGAMMADLRRQAATSTLVIDESADKHGRIKVSGPLDLAALAHASEMALRDFGAGGGK